MYGGHTTLKDFEKGVKYFQLFILWTLKDGQQFPQRNFHKQFPQRKL